MNLRTTFTKLELNKHLDNVKVGTKILLFPYIKIYEVIRSFVDESYYEDESSIDFNNEDDSSSTSDSDEMVAESCQKYVKLNQEFQDHRIAKIIYDIVKMDGEILHEYKRNINNFYSYVFIYKNKKYYINPFNVFSDPNGLQCQAITEFEIEDDSNLVIRAQLFPSRNNQSPIDGIFDCSTRTEKIINRWE